MSYITLRGVNNYSDVGIDSEIGMGLQYFFDWGTLNVGGFQNVQRSQATIYGGNQARLRPVRSPGYADGRVWEAIRKNWVWETGLTYAVQPIDISGIWVNSVFQPKDISGSYAHIIDYTNGQIIFNTAISTGNTVELNYSFKRVYYTYQAEEEWYQRLQFETLKFNGNQFQQFNSGMYNELAQARVQLPAVVFEIVGGDSPVGYELGHNSQYMYRDVLYTVIAEKKWERDNLVSLIQLQNHKTINLPDFNEMAAQSKFPLNMYGSRASGALMYPDIVNPNNNLVWRGCYLKDAKVLNAGRSNMGLYTGLVKSTVEVIV